MDPQRSGQYRAGTIVLLVGAILQAVGALFAFLFGLVFGAIFQEIQRQRNVSLNPEWMTGLFLAVAALAAVGSVFSFLAYAKASRGDPRGAFLFGLVGSLLPPLHAVVLVGAILCRFSPEGEGHPPHPAPPPSYPPGWQRP